MGSARETALKALERCRRGGAWSDAVLDSIIKNDGLDRRDAALATRLCYGVLQNQALSDYCIGKYSKLKPSKLEPKLLDIMRLSVYQVIFMDKIPSEVAVNEGVSLAKKLGLSRASGMVNAILRRVAENKDTLIDVADKKSEEYLAVRYSHPLWLVSEFVNILGEEQAEALLKANNEDVPIMAQVNTLKTTTSELAGKLKATVHPWIDDMLLLDGMAAAFDTGALEDGLLYIQDAAAKLAVLAAAPAAGMHILDACAAPGGKSFAAAILTENKAKITACDIHEKKLRRVEEGAKKLGIICIDTLAMDARVPEKSFFQSFDLVIADVPCSGLGVIRKKPDIRYKNPDELLKLPEIQLDILQNLSNYVKPGGTLLYSTCTILRRENEDVIEAFLSDNKDFKTESFSLPEPIGRVEGAMITLLPHIHKTDGFFICKLKRSN